LICPNCDLINPEVTLINPNVDLIHPYSNLKNPNEVKALDISRRLKLPLNLERAGIVIEN